MSHTSAPTYLVWSIFCTLLFSFFLFHLWRFDRFRCLRWSGAYSGAFKRLMTYSYALTIPLLGVYAIGFAVIKYQEGEVTIEPFGTIPKPHQLWTQTHQHLIFPLQMTFSVGWSLELVTHLEELCFWLYLVNSGSVQQDWFKSPYFKTWVTGAIVAVIYMPLVTIFTRSDPLRNEAFTFLAGSLGSLSLTLWFTPILWTFPTFLDSLKREGVDNSTIVRLTKFHELNTIRVIFRFFMSVPIVILGVDGVKPHVHINTSIFWTDFLTIVAGFGCCVSSGITLVIFFPRSIEGEIAERDARKQSKQLRSLGYGTHMSDARSSAYSLPYSATQQPQQLSSATYLNPSSNGHERVASPFSQRLSYTDEKDEQPSDLPKLPAIRPNRRISDKEVELGGVDSLTEGNLSRHNVRQSGFSSVLQNFKSPIDLVYMSEPEDVNRKGNDSRLTFNRRRP